MAILARRLGADVLATGHTLDDQLVYALKDLSALHVAGSRSRPYLPLVVGFVVLSVGLFVWFWPVLTGGPLSDEAFRLRAWFPSWT